jgi:hypothetical protein
MHIISFGDNYVGVRRGDDGVGVGRGTNVRVLAERKWVWDGCRCRKRVLGVLVSDREEGTRVWVSEEGTMVCVSLEGRWCGCR